MSESFDWLAVAAIWAATKVTEHHSSMRKLMRAVLWERMALLMQRSARCFTPSGLSRTSCCTRSKSLDTCTGTVTVPQTLLLIWGQEQTHGWIELSLSLNWGSVLYSRTHSLITLPPRHKKPQNNRLHLSFHIYSRVLKHIVSGRCGNGTRSCMVRSMSMCAHGKCDHVYGSGRELMVCWCIGVYVHVCVFVSEATQFWPLFSDGPSKRLEDWGNKVAHAAAGAHNREFSRT